MLGNKLCLTSQSSTWEERKREKITSLVRRSLLPLENLLFTSKSSSLWLNRNFITGTLYLATISSTVDLVVMVPSTILQLCSILECLKHRPVLFWQCCASAIRQTRTRQCLHKQHSSWCCRKPVAVVFWQKNSLEVPASQSNTCKEKKKGNNKNIFAANLVFYHFHVEILTKNRWRRHFDSLWIVWRVYVILGCVSALGGFLLFPLEGIIRLQALSCLHIVRVRDWTFCMHCSVKEIVPNVSLPWIMGTEVSVLMEVPSGSESRLFTVHWRPNTNKFSLLSLSGLSANRGGLAKNTDGPISCCESSWGHENLAQVCQLVWQEWEAGEHCQALSSSAGFQMICFAVLLQPWALLNAFIAHVGWVLLWGRNCQKLVKCLNCNQHRVHACSQAYFCGTDIIPESPWTNFHCML